MSALGQKQTFCDARAMSALPPKADICSAHSYVRFVPKADIRQRISREGLDLGPTYAELLLRIHTLVRVTFTRLIWINGQPPSRRQYSFLETSLGRETMSKRRMLIAFFSGYACGTTRLC